MSQHSKAVVQDVYERVWNEGDLDAIDELYSESFVGHVAGQSEPLRGPAALRGFVAMMRSAFSDLEMTIERQVAEGGLVATHWRASGTHNGELMGVAATGRPVTLSGMNFNLIDDGRVVEAWGVFDALGMLEQLGAVSLPGHD